MKKVLLLFLLVIGCRAALGQTSICMNGNWQFFYAKDMSTADSLVEKGFYKPEFEAKEFVSTPVPSNWAIQGFEEPVYRGFPDDKAGEGLYLHHFAMPDSFKGKRVLLHFGGVWNSAEVWLNGEWTGRHDSGFTSFSMDVTNYVKAGKDNLLAVRVRQVYPGYKTDTYDDWTLGGIYRDVTLESMPAKRRIDRVRVNTKMTGDVDVRVMVADEYKSTLPGNYPSPGKPYQLHLVLSDRDGKVVAEKTMDVKAHTANSRETRVSFKVDNANLWTAETPYLYTLRAELVETGDGSAPVTSHVVQQKIGIREISTRGGVFRINGQAVKLRGVNRHDEHPDVGRATTREHWLEDLRLMKAANINYVRACHYQHAKGFIEMCDSLGMYVGAEVSLGGANTLMYNPNFLPAALLRTIETVERDINNPSVIYWSVGNEDSFKDMLLQCVRTIKGLDSTRPVLLPWNADETLPEEIDILAPHYWTAREYDSIASRSTRPIITTEYVHAYGNQRFGGLGECWKAFMKNPAAAGGAVWMWADQGVRTPTKKDPKVYHSIEKDDEYLRIDGQGWDGITDSDRRPTQDYWEVKAVYCPVEVADVRLIKGAAADNDYKASAVDCGLYNGYDFTNLSTVNIGWELFVDGKLKDKGFQKLDAAPHATATLSVPLSKVGRIKPGETPYIRLTFTDAGGYEIGKRSVEFKPSGNDFISAKKCEFEIDKSTGLPRGMRPTVWHKFNDGDEIIRNRKGLDMEKYSTKLISSSTEQLDGNTITNTVARYTVNDSTYFDARYRSLVDSDGKMTIDYEITPYFKAKYIPVVGLAMKMKSPESLKQWFGLGPEEAYPNKRTAQMLGLWDADNLCGTRAMRWADVDGYRVYCDGYIDRDTADSSEVRFLSHVLGRSEKGRLNYPEYRLESGKTYKGSMIVIRK